MTELLTFPDPQLPVQVLPDVATYWLLYIAPPCHDIACIFKDLVM